MENIFDTPEKVNLAVSNFKTLKDHPGWQLLRLIVDANIKVLEEQILNGSKDETKEMIDRERDKLTAYKEVIGTPDYWIKQLETPELVQSVEDPYHTVKSYYKKNKSA